MCSRLSCHDSRRRKRAHLARPRLVERAGTRLEGRSCGTDIIDEHDDGSGEAAGRSPRPKRGADVPVAARGCQRCLRHRRPHALERMDNGQSQSTREIVCLVETALTAPGRMERHRNDGLSALQNRPALFTHARGKRHGKRPPPVVLERVHNRAKRAGVLTNSPAPRDSRLDPPAARTTGPAQGDDAPGRQRIAADVAERRGERANRRPADGTNRALCRVVQKGAAGGAGRREEDTEKSIDESRRSPPDSGAGGGGRTRPTR